MKSCHLFLILVVAMFGTNAESVEKPFTMTSVSVPAPLPTELNSKGSATFGLLARNDLYGPVGAPGLFADLRQDVVHDVRVTRALIHKGAAKVSKYDGWLLLLAAIGLIVLQLRRTQRLLPQRSIIAY
jgi:hypothetical protein